MTRRLLIGLACAVAACGRPSSGTTSCGIAAVAGPTLLLSEFAAPGQALSVPPRTIPEKVVVRMAAGGAYRGLVGRTDSGLVVGAEGVIPPVVHPAFGVLVVDPAGDTRGVLLYESTPIRGAAKIGTVVLGAERAVPLLGIQLDAGKYEDTRCPTFPDSVLR